MFYILLVISGTLNNAAVDIGINGRVIQKSYLVVVATLPRANYKLFIISLLKLKRIYDHP